MLKFKAITKENVKELLPFFLAKKSQCSDYSLGISFVWRDSYNIQFAIANKTLIMKIDYGDHNTCFYYPIGDDVEAAFRLINEYALNFHNGLEFCCLEGEELTDIKRRYPKCLVLNNRNWSDYVYNLEDHASFKGNQLSNKRNLYNRFFKQYPYHSIKNITRGDLPKLLAFYDEYSRDIGKIGSHQQDEISNTRELLTIFDFLNFEGIYVEVGEHVVGMALGELVGDTLYVHIEKALPGYLGVYQVLVKELANRFLGRACYINREEDDGDLGLRESKLQYKPCRLIEKTFLMVKNNLLLLNSLPTLESTNCTLSLLTRNYQDAYCDMVLDESLNEFWGYDYRTDLHGCNPSPDYFYQDVLNDFKEKTHFNFIISNRKTGEFMGEIVLYELTDLNQTEVGIRLLRRYQHLGYGKETLEKVLEYLFNVVQLDGINSRCYKQNVASFGLFIALDFILRDEDDQFFYFEKRKN